MSEKPMVGDWALISPDGREYKAESPLKCCRAEQLERIPVEEQLENLHYALYGVCDLCGDEFYDGEKKYTHAKNTPAEIGPLCGACSGTILSEAKPKLLAKKHSGMRVDHSGILGRIAGGCKVRPDQRYILGVMDKHLEETAERFYSGDIRAVDEFLQLYCLDDKRPK